ncbi:MAG: regulatory protein RecX [Dehalococcoidia bacterium]
MDEPPSQPTIIEIRSIARGRQRLVSLSDGREFAFMDEACERMGITEGMSIVDGLLESLDAAELRVTAHEAALRLLASRPRAEKEMRTRLAMRGFEPAVIEEELERLRRAGLLDDQKFARAWVEDRKRVAPRGRRMLRYELLGRGIDVESVDLATDGIDDRETALALARSRARGSAMADYETFMAKIGGFLRRRGFDYSISADAARTVWAEVGGNSDQADDRGIEAQANP